MDCEDNRAVQIERVATFAGSLLAENMPEGVQFVLLAYTDRAKATPSTSDYMVCYRSDADNLEAAMALRHMAESIEDGASDSLLPAV